jgi:hypothetical protein
VFGQSFDQFRAMQAKGHPNPFAAVCSFNELYITWLDSKQHMDVLQSHTANDSSRMESIWRQVPNFQIRQSGNCKDRCQIQYYYQILRKSANIIEDFCTTQNFVLYYR